MARFEVLMVPALYISIFISSMLFLRILYRTITRKDMPPVFKDRVKVLTLELLLYFTFELDRLLTKLGICKEFALLRMLFDGSSPPEISDLPTEDLIFDDVPVRVYWPKTSVVGRRRGMLYIHGGVGVLGSIQAYDRTCSAIARESDSVVVNVGFRLAPEYPFPTQIRDCLTAAIYFLNHAEDYGVDPNRIIVGGDSSGATYSTVVAQELVTQVDLPRLKAQILIYPFLQALDFNLPSYQKYQTSPTSCKELIIALAFRSLNKKVRDVDGISNNAHVSEAMRVKYRKWINPDLIQAEFKLKVSNLPKLAPFSEELCEESKEALETRFSPLLADDEVIRQLPTTFLLTCEYDMFRDDGVLYKKRLEDNSVPVTWYHAENGVHGCFSYAHNPYFGFQSSRACFNHVIHFLQAL